MSTIKDKIYIEEGKPEIDLTGWLNTVSNLPEVWKQIMSELLDQRYGVFTYKFDDSMVRETKDGKTLSKPYNIDLKISIGTSWPKGMSYEEHLKYNDELSELSKEQKERLDKLRGLFKLFDEYMFNGSLNVEAIKKGLDDL